MKNYEGCMAGRQLWDLN